MKSAVSFESLFILTGEHLIRGTLCKDVRGNVQEETGKCEGASVGVLGPGLAAQAYVFLVHSLCGPFPSSRLRRKNAQKTGDSRALAPCRHGFRDAPLGRGPTFRSNVGLFPN